MNMTRAAAASIHAVSPLFISGGIAYKYLLWDKYFDGNDSRPAGGTEWG